MTDFLEDLTTAARDFETDGVPASGAHQVEKALLRQGFRKLATVLAGLAIAATGADFDVVEEQADLPPTPGNGDLAFVWGDADLTKIDLYVGSSSAWQATGVLRGDILSRLGAIEDVTAATATLALALLTPAANKGLYFTSGSAAATYDLSAFGRQLGGLADEAALRTAAGLVIGTHVQQQSANLQSLAGLTLAPDKLLYATGTNTLAQATLTAFARSVLDDADASTALSTLGLSANAKSLVTAADYAAMRTLLSLGSLALLSSVNNANWSGTALAVANGGTGATDAPGARTAIGAAPLDAPSFTTSVTLPGDPVAALHAAPKQYVDNLAAGLKVKGSVRAATTANITLSGAQTIDGVSVIAGDRVLVKDQSSASANGIYVAASGAWSRATDADAWAELPGAMVTVEEGTANADKGFVSTVNAGGTLGSTAVTWSQFMGAGAFQAASTAGAALAALTPAADKGFYFTGSGSAATFDLPSFARTALAAFSSQVAARAALAVDVALSGDAFAWTFDGFEVSRLDASGNLTIDGDLTTKHEWPISDALLRAYCEGFIEYEIDLEGEQVWPPNGLSGSSTTTKAVLVQSSPGYEDKVVVRYDVTGNGPGVCQLKVGKTADLADVLFVSEPVTPRFLPTGAGIGFRCGKAVIDGGLAPNTRYYYRADLDDKEGEIVGTFMTPPLPGEDIDFAITATTCSEVDPATPFPVFTAMAAEDAAFHWQGGDAQYSNIMEDDIRLDRSSNWHRYLQNADVAADSANVPTVHSDGDHEGGGGDDGHADKVLTGTTYRQVVMNALVAANEIEPHLPRIDPRMKMQRLQWGSREFIFLDTQTWARYLEGEVTSLGTGENPPGSPNQRQILLDFLESAPDRGVKHILLCTPRGVGPAYDGWKQRYEAEWTLLLNFIADLPTWVTVLTGDFHRGASDDGTNTRTSGSLKACVAQHMFSPSKKSGNLLSGGPFTWNGAASAVLVTEQYGLVSFSSDLTYQVEHKGSPFDGADATVHETYRSDDVTPAVEFSSASASAAAGSTYNVPVKRSWFGPWNGLEVEWSTSDGQSGTLAFGPNLARSTIPVVTPTGSAITVTLSDPTRSELGAQTTFTLSHT